LYQKTRLFRGCSLIFDVKRRVEDDPEKEVRLFYQVILY